MPRFWRQCRIAFRCVRFAVWLLILAALGVLLWCNRVGLPDFLKIRLVAMLQEHGVALEFSRMRLSLTHGVVAENVRAGTGDVTLGAQMVQLRLDFSALWRRRLQLDGLSLRDGYGSLPLSPTNTLALTNLQARLRFDAGDLWTFERLDADFSGAHIQLSGAVAHAAAAANWKLLGGSGGGTNRGALFAALKNVSDTLQQIHFEGEPQLNLALTGDARDVHSMTVQLAAAVNAVRTPWFAARDVQFNTRLTAPADAPTNTDAALAFWTNLQPFRLAWSLQLADLRSEKLNAETVHCAGVWSAPTLAVTNLSARLGGGRLDAAAQLDVLTRQVTFTNDAGFDLHAVAALLTEKARERLAQMAWTQPPSLRATGSLRLPPWTDAAASWREDIEPSVQVEGELAFTNAVAGGVPVDRLQTHFRYADWVWTLPDLTLAQGRTRLALSGEENETTKKFRYRVRGWLDADSVRPFLTTSNAARGFAHLTPREPLALDLALTGSLQTLADLTATGRVALTNFAVRGQAVDSAAASVTYADGLLQFLQPEMRRAQGAQTMTADAVTLDFKQQLIRFVNGFSTTDPAALTQAIGPKTAQLLEPYHFLRPPTARVNGCLPLRNMNGPDDMTEVDLRFDIVAGVPFQWLKLTATSLQGTIHWLGGELILTNLQAELYGGTGTGEADFDFRPAHEGADYQFSLAVTNVNLHQFAASLSSSNRLEGILAGTLVVTRADTRDLDSWNGYGAVKLHDGLLWDIPIFGILSPVLNAVSAGLGNSRATEATANYTITNGIIHSDSLDIRSTMMRLSYTGTVDMRQNVNARVTARLLRDVWVVGPLVSTVLWPVSKIFECRVTGKLSDPQPTPIYFPKILLAPLHPIRSLEELFNPSAPATNPPAK
jgi:hypothetical protein